MSCRALQMTKTESRLAVGKLCLFLGGVLRRFLSEWTGCNDTLVSEVSKQNCPIPSVCHTAAVTVILLKFY